VIFAKKFKWLIRRRNTLVNEAVDSLLPCRHRSRLSYRYNSENRVAQSPARRSGAADG
jgi:hypothetical protein